MNRTAPRAAAATALAFAWLWTTVVPARAADAPEIPRGEHPTPDAVRPFWATLNGPWAFRFDPKDEGLKAGWEKPGAAGFDRSIVVPFPWESELSGVHDSRYKGVAWYRREFQVPDGFPKEHRVWLRFGAVDWQADVWVNGEPVAEHEGGYTPFEADVTEAVKKAEGKPSVVVVRAYDPTDPGLPTGKQVGWYTPTSGIWQTVWLEARPKTWIGGFRVKTEIDPGRATFEVAIGKALPGVYKFAARPEKGAQAPPPTEVSVRQAGETVVGAVAVNFPDPKLWTPETPNLYDVTLELTGPDGSTDTVKTYVGLRTIARGKYGDEPFERVLLNGKPVYLRTALDQSFNPKGVYTAPSDQFLKDDLLLAKQTGLNGLRIHIKPDEPRRLYWADRLGLLILEDMPNTWRQDARARAAWEATMREVVPRDRNHPSVVAWVAFNETWGLGRPDAYKQSKDTQDWVNRMVGAIRKLDPTRLVEDVSPCNYDHVADTDLNSWHFYIDDHPGAARHVDDVVRQTKPGSPFNYCPGVTQGTAPLINSEYGGVGAGDGDRDVSWAFRDLTTLLRRQPKIQGYVYTELTDIEWEHNGFANYDRSPKTFGYGEFVPEMTPFELNGADFIGYGGPPAVVVKPGERVSIPWFISHFSERTGLPKLRWWVQGWNDDANVDTVVVPETRTVSWRPYDVVEQEPLAFNAPERPFVGAVALTLRDSENRRIAANFVNVVVRPDAPLPRAAKRSAKEAVLRFRPDDFARQRWSGGAASTVPGKAAGSGAGYFEFKLKVPPAVVKAKPVSYFLRLEAGSRAGREKVGWPGHDNPMDYPQTDAKTWPSTLAVLMNGREVVSERLPDDPADALGVLSHLARRDPGSHGELLEYEGKFPDPVRDDLAAGKPLVLRLAVPDGAAAVGGLSLYGAETGRFPFDPTLEIVTEDDLPEDLGVDRGAAVALDRLADRRTVVLATGESNAPTEWAYTTTDPGAGWSAPEFNDSGWKRGKAGFGSPGTPAVRVNTRWDNDRIWLRAAVEVPTTGPEDLWTPRIFHDEDVEVFVNGTRVFSAGGYTSAYRDLEATEAFKKALRPGKNVFAVSCRQSAGGQGVDLGLTVLRPAPE